MRRRVRLTPFGYLFVAVLILLLLGGVFLIVRGIANGGDRDKGKDSSIAEPFAPGTLVTPIPDDPTDPALPTDPVTGAPLPGTPVGGSTTVSDPGTFPPTGGDPASTVPVTAPAETPTPTPEKTPEPTPEPVNNVKKPSSSEEKNAKEGKLTTGGVVLRGAPNTNGEILGKYVKGTNLKVYSESGDYYLVQIVKEEKYGYMAKKFVEVNTATPEPITTSVPEGAVGGTVRSSLVALRSSADLNDSGNKVGEVKQGEPVYIYYKYTNGAGDTFYYIEVARTGKKAFAFAEYITAESAVPSGTP